MRLENSRISTRAVLIIILVDLVATQFPASLAQGSSAPNAQQRKFHLKLHRSGLVDIPGLYDDHDGIITPIQGREQFHSSILGLGASHRDESNGTSENPLGQCDRATLSSMAQNQTVSLVQFYMATCPDCQGFSAYFKRFASDIAPHWRSLVRIFTVNCNDFKNIHLCQEENPRLIVPMVRWYAPPMLQAAGRSKKACDVQLSFSKNLLNVAHRKFIEKQRRDMISLRRATLKYLDLVMNELRERRANATGETLYDWLPMRWHLLRKLASESRQARAEATATTTNSSQLFFHDLQARQEQFGCKSTVKNVVIFENHPSSYSMGRLAVADWSNGSMACTPPPPSTNETALLVHWTSDFSLLKRLAQNSLLRALPAGFGPASGTLEWAGISPVAIGVDLGPSPSASFLAANISEPAKQAERLLSRRHAQQRLARISQRASLQRFYSQNPASPQYRYASTMSSAGPSRHKRDANMTKAQQQAEAEHINWAPELLWPRVEWTRYKLNEAIAGQLNLAHWPGQQFGGVNQGELDLRRIPAEVDKVEARDDDLSLMLLTDYYKALDEIVHVDLIAKGELDGYQLLASTCFLQALKRHFPFQGSAQAAEYLGHKSVAFYYLDQIQRRWFGELLHKLQEQQRSNSTRATRLHSLSDACPDVREFESRLKRGHLSLANATISTRQLEQHQADVRKQANVGLAPSNKLSWKYCAGSEANLRGHTCSLWILFHTLSVQEYLGRLPGGQENSTRDQEDEPPEYKYQIDYGLAPKSSCDPKNPEKAFLGSGSSELFVANATSNVLATIINFVRFYLPCTGCAAHFSCMVEHSPSLQFEAASDTDKRQSDDSHLLWLWEGHNRVNLRTRGTHSEDATRPKHVFPVYEACPKCYMEKPTKSEPDSLAELRFNRRELVRFIVARYRRSAILNNKINIEDLYKG